MANKKISQLQSFTGMPQGSDLIEVVISGVNYKMTRTKLIEGLQALLESGVNIKTINGDSILGSGNLDVAGGGGGDLQSTLDAGESASAKNINLEATDDGLGGYLGGNFTSQSFDGKSATFNFDGLTLGNGDEFTQLRPSGLVVENFATGDNIEIGSGIDGITGFGVSVQEALKIAIQRSDKLDFYEIIADVQTLMKTISKGTATAAGQVYELPDAPTDTYIMPISVNGEFADAAGNITISGGGAVDSVNTQTGAVVLNQDDILDGTTYKQYSATEKTKLAGIASGATANSSDATLLNRANHTGTQLAATISDFASTVLATVLTGISFVTATAVTAADSVLVALGKLQAQITANVSSIAAIANLDLVYRNGIRTLSSDFFSANANGNTPYMGVAILSGTTVFNTAEVTDVHVGVVRLSSSATANSGYYWSTGNGLRTSAGLKSNTIFKTPTSFSNVTIRIGFHDASTSADAVNGMYFDIPASASVVGKTSNNSTQTTSATITTLATDTWYHFQIEVVSTSSVNFRIFNIAGVQQGSTINIATNLPDSARVFGDAIIATCSAASATIMGYLDYKGVTLPNMQRGSTT